MIAVAKMPTMVPAKNAGISHQIEIMGNTSKNIFVPLDLGNNVDHNNKKERCGLAPADAPVEDVAVAHPRKGDCNTLFHP